MTQVISTIAELRRAIRALKSGQTEVGLVPTMGALHEAHGQLFDRAKSECTSLVASIFVNPLQFGPAEDFDRYPRNLEEDLGFCKSRSVDILFAPSLSEMYPVPPVATVTVDGVTESLCGRYRPEHFRGVATVVCKLFNLVQPNRAYFGEKDAQQLVVIRRMVEDLNIPVEIREIPVVRAADGVALSSRNALLSQAERAQAPLLYKSLKAVEAALAKGIQEASRALQEGHRVLEKSSEIQLQYFEIVDPKTLKPTPLIQGPVRIAAAILLGPTRLIDTLLWRP